MNINSKSSLAIALSKLEVFKSPSVKLEQYTTDPEVAASALWNLAMNKDIEGKVIADLGCGTGVIGIGALLLGASKVYFVDIDTAALGILGNNLKSLGIDEEEGELFEIVNKNVSEFDASDVDIVIQNPPFGTRQEHADKVFLEKAFGISDVVVSFHKTSTKKFVEVISKDHGFIITHRWSFSFPLKKTLEQHKSNIKRIEVSCFRMEKN